MRRLLTALALACASACGSSGTRPVEHAPEHVAVNISVPDGSEREVRVLPVTAHLLENDRTREAALAMRGRSDAIIETIRDAVAGRIDQESEVFAGAFWEALENEGRDFILDHMFVYADYLSAPGVAMRVVLRWDASAGPTFNYLDAKVGEGGELSFRLGDMERARKLARFVQLLQTHTDVRVMHRPYLAGAAGTLVSMRVPEGVRACVLSESADESRCYSIPAAPHPVSDEHDELCFDASGPSDIEPCAGGAWSRPPRPLPNPPAEFMAMHGMEGEVRGDVLSARLGYSGDPYVVCVRQADTWACGDGGHVRHEYSVGLSDTSVQLPWVVSVRKDVEEAGSEGGGSSVALIVHRVRENRLELQNEILLGESHWSRDGAEGAYGSDVYETANVRLLAQGCMEIDEGRIHRRRSIPPNIDERHPNGLEVDEWIPSAAPHGRFAITPQGDLQDVTACERSH